MLKLHKMQQTPIYIYIIYLFSRHWYVSEPFQQAIQLLLGNVFLHVGAFFQASRWLLLNNEKHCSLHTVTATICEFRCHNRHVKMSDSKFKIFKFVKIIISSLLIAVLVLFTVASIRTFSLDVNVGLQLSHWEKTNNISLVIAQHQREELLANFKGNSARACYQVASLSKRC